MANFKMRKLQENAAERKLLEGEIEYLQYRYVYEDYYPYEDDYWCGCLLSHSGSEFACSRCMERAYVLAYLSTQISLGAKLADVEELSLLSRELVGPAT